MLQKISHALAKYISPIASSKGIQRAAQGMSSKSSDASQKQSSGNEPTKRKGREQESQQQPGQNPNQQKQPEFQRSLFKETGEKESPPSSKTAVQPGLTTLLSNESEPTQELEAQDTQNKKKKCKKKDSDPRSVTKKLIDLMTLIKRVDSSQNEATQSYEQISKGQRRGGKLSKGAMLDYDAG